jgi:hypothetical protein
VAIDVSASIANSGVGGTAVMTLSGTTSGPLSLPDFGCVALGAMALTASFSLKPLVLLDVELSGSVSVCDFGAATGHFKFNKASGAVEFSLELVPTLPLPFHGTAPLALVITRNQLSNAYQLQGNFSATLTLPNAPSDVSVAVTALVTNPGGAGLLAQLSGSTSDAITVPGFECLTFEPFHLEALMALNHTSPSLKSLHAIGGVSVCGVGRAVAAFDYDTETHTTLFGMTLSPELPPPFAPQTSIEMTLTKSGAITQLLGSFSAVLDLPGSSTPVTVNANTAITNTGGMTSMLLHGSTSAPLTIPDVECLTFSTMVMDAALDLTPNVTLRRLSLSGETGSCKIGTAIVPIVPW